MHISHNDPDCANTFTAVTDEWRGILVGVDQDLHFVEMFDSDKESSYRPYLQEQLQTMLTHARRWRHGLQSAGMLTDDGCCVLVQRCSSSQSRAAPRCTRSAKPSWTRTATGLRSLSMPGPTTKSRPSSHASGTWLLLLSQQTLALMFMLSSLSMVSVHA